MKIYEIFQSIDGEVNAFHQGRITTFIRLAGCNLNCTYCFGVLPGRRIPRIITSRTPNKKLHEVKVGDKLMTFDSEHRLVETTVTEVITREVDSWYRLKINNVTYYVTEEHPIFTTRGLVKVSNLKIGDKIYHSSSNDKLSFSKLGSNNPMKRGEVAARSAANTDYKAMGEKVSKTIKKKQRLDTYKPLWELLSKHKREELRIKMSARMKGELNPNWKGGSKTPNYDLLKELCRIGKLNTCQLCSKDKVRVIPHHIDDNQLNDNPSNIQIVCYPCHNSIHKRGYNFWNGNRQDNKTLTSESEMRRLDHNGYEVQKIEYIDRNKYPPSIRPKPLKVYNLSCYPYNTYLIDYMWSHNCDTQYAADPDSGTEMSVDEIVSKVKELGGNKVTITGGEPLLQGAELNLLTTQLWQNQFKISVETNGTYVPSAYGVGSWVVDFKLPSSGNYRMMKRDLFVDLTKKDYVKFVIMDENDYLIAIREMGHLKYMGCHANFAFSPMFGPQSTPINEIKHKLVEWLIRDKVFDAIVNVQIHKLLGVA